MRKLRVFLNIGFKERSRDFKTVSKKWFRGKSGTKLLALDLFWLLIFSSGLHFGRDITYGWHLLQGQMRILLQSRRIEKMLSDPATPDTLRQKLKWVQDIRQFATDSLGLTKNRNYTRYYAHTEGLLYVLTACEKYSLRPYLWKFPVIGSVSYKGFLDPIMARREWEELLARGYDVRLRIVDAWSTLGYFPDPVTTGMLQTGEENLANVLIHEMFHATLYIPDSTELSEGLATRVGDAGALLYLKTKYGPGSVRYQNYLEILKTEKRYVRYLNQCAARLDSLYQHPAFLAAHPSEKDSLKKWYFHMFAERCSDHLQATVPPVYCENLRHQLRQANNAFFTIFRQYHLPDSTNAVPFQSVAELRNYIKELKKQYGKKS
ncbi:MAG: aminopeptidase [Flavobacteriales bacterium]|nr:aminopeptidase [Flavobacteriales bacterium]MCX7650149.1 aminopeptidase [Flavobacteriales bacterium]MDW8432859.1 aminopeptidase [Flavobacteriales bacterium]